MTPLTRRQVYGLAGIVALAFAFRLLFLPQTDLYYWYGGMTEGFRIAGKNVADGRGYVLGDQQYKAVDTYDARRNTVIPVEQVPVFPGDRYQPRTDRPPAYAVLLAGSLRLFGHGWPLPIFQILIDSTVPLLLFGIARRLFPLRVAFLSGLLYALWPPFARNSVHGLPESFIPFLLAAFLALFLAGLEAQRWPLVILAGCTAGLIPYFRTEWALFPGFLAILTGIVDRRLLLRSCTVLAISAVLVSPWLVRNYLITGRPLLTTETGIILWEGLGQFPNPWGAARDDTDVAREMKAQGLTDPVAADTYFTRRFVSAVLQHPLTYASEVARRATKALFPKTDWGLTVLYETTPAFAARPDALIEFALTFPGWLLFKAIPSGLDSLLPLAAAAGFALSLRRGKGTWFLAAPPLFAILINSLTFFVARFMVPAVFPYCIFAALACDAVVAASRRATHR